MGYTPSKILNLTFTDPDMAQDYTGEPLNVRVRPPTLGDLRKLMPIARLRGNGLADLGDEDMAAFEQMIEVFAKRLVSWNVEIEHDDGTRVPVAATVDGLNSLDLEFAFKLIAEWAGQAVTVKPDLKDGSPNGGMLAMLPMTANQ